MIPATQTEDRAARERIRTSLDESLIVEASAGTGKTSELIRRIVAVLAAGTAVEEIVAVTFTHKAAGELKLRLRAELDKARAAAKDFGARHNLEDALARLEEAAIGTIHGFCAQILHERPVEARIDPAFEELTEPEADRIYSRAFDQWFQHKLDAGSPALRRALARLAWRESWKAETPPVEALRSAGEKLVGWRDKDASWRREAGFDRRERIDALLARCRALAGMAGHCTRSYDPLLRGLRPLFDLLASPRTIEPDYDTIEARLVRLEPALKKDFKAGSGNFAPGIQRSEVLAAREDLLRDLHTFAQDSGADFAAALRDEMQDLVGAYEESKRRAGKLDFLDLLLMVRNLVRHDPGVRNYLQERYSRIFVDEFQDTDPLQAEILILLTADDPSETSCFNVTPKPGKLFVVGDPKQSIYKFRRADVVLYESLCEALGSRGVARIRLTTSYRAVRPIQQLVNAAFAPEMTGDNGAGQARYVPLEEYTSAYEQQPAIVVLPAPRPYGVQRVNNEKVDACQPDAIASFIDWLIHESNWQVRDPRDPEGARIPIRARHICVLFRRFVTFGDDISRDYTQALEARDIPHLLVGSKSFYHRDEVETVRVALSAIEYPEDELSVYGTLRGSLFAIPDDLLLRFRLEGGRRRLNPRHPPADLPPEFQPVTDALSVLGDLHRRRNWRPVAETIHELLETTRAHAGFSLRRAGSQALANVYRICDLARTFEVTGGLSFRGFIEELAREAEKADSMEAPVLEEASDGVRLMTVHSAKGLEFPVVILADMTAKLARAPERFVDANLCATRVLGAAPWELLENESREFARECAEGVRIAYVAATRARDLLVIPAVGDEEREGWLSPLNKAIYPPRDRRRIRAAAEGCPPFKGDRTVLERPSDLAHLEEYSVHPGQHGTQTGDHSVVWWDPASLRLNVARIAGLHNEEILAAEPADRAASGIARHDEWKAERLSIIDTGRAPAFQIVSPTDGLGEPPQRQGIQVVTITPQPGRPGGPRFGILVHAVLRDLDLAGKPDQIASLALVHSRVLGEPEFAESAHAAVVAVWEHSVLNRARGAARCHRELPFHLPLDIGQSLEGVIDLAFLEKDRWVVVDFKTDSVESIRYQRQLQWYVYALSQLTGRPGTGILLQL